MKNKLKFEGGMKRRGMGFDIILKSILAEGLEDQILLRLARPRFVYTSYL